MGIIEEVELRKVLSKLPTEFGLVYKSDVNRMIDKLLKEEQAAHAKINNLAFDMIKWERDVAISQLNDIGVQFGEKVDDVVKVIRCKDCAHSEVLLAELPEKLWCVRLVTENNDVYAEVVDKEHFCGRGERKQKEGF